MSVTAQHSAPAISALGSEGISTREIDRRKMAHDASHYLLVPQAVATPSSTAEVAQLLRRSRELGIPATFRSGGTSLSGQAVSDSLLIDTRHHFRDIEVLDGGARVRVAPGATVRSVNSRLAAFGRKLGPDPASEIACTIGGVVANNSSGMACGTEFNTYRTLESMVLVLASGTVLDTGAPDAEEKLRALEPELFEGLLRLRGRIVANPDSVATITRLFSMKNTMGYGLNSFLDFENPADILAHLMIGSEGTLGFVAEATFRTIPALPKVATGLMFFDSLDAAATALPELTASGLATVELMDATSLRVARQAADAPLELRNLEVQSHAALLVEHQAATVEELEAKRDASQPLFESLRLAAPFAMTTDARDRAGMWHMRKGLYTTVAGARPSGTNALLEDIVVPVPSLARTCAELATLFTAHHYRDSVIFGHAKDGNIHFMLNENFSDPAELARYEAFTEEMVDLVLGEGGSLKAEHGTGRIMAPYVRRQYGDELYEIMVEVKQLIDPAHLLNPGVLINDDPRSYVQNLKVAPTVEAEVDRCVECGYCEPVCPSKDITTTPRQRIVLRREIADAEARGDSVLAATLRADYDYDGVQTCAVDGMCGTACPVLINTGDLVRRLRAENANKAADAGWKAAAGRWGTMTSVGGKALSLAKAVPSPLPKLATAVGRAVLGADNVQSYETVLPAGGSRRTPHEDADPVAVFFPACIGTMFGPAKGGEGSAPAFMELCDRAGVGVRVPKGIENLCCGTPWKSKGFTSGYSVMTEKVLANLWVATNGGELPVVCDAASCTEGLDTMKRLAGESPVYPGLRFVDSVDFVRDAVLPRLEVKRKLGSLALHPTCSSTQLGANDALTGIAAAVSAEVFVPPSWGCCAFAGDRGLLHPELTASATQKQAEEINERVFDGYASVNRTCEIGMTKATGHDYRHILEYLAEATR
ncbi:FAD-binding and (Fe-S)-binding domain-containing protein [Arthrobacter koreensis]|uniref:FAD-binding and (Fe-S)-binding domain-containing protein n=1 Tax=Arthrobacter koreensis TaxID=199136 RepID=UPI002DB8E2EC|nr:FAD-binding and (Fe-S)-binding domain-containing protein [Arthrobacter koreensis]MEB7505927.1 FAD-binding oxidoreductase [Arthrobacter koreensis]